MGNETELLRDYLEARDGLQEEALLARLVFDAAFPVVRRTVARRLLTAPEQDREDIAGDVILDLVSRLKRLKQSNDMPIERFAAYVAATAHNGCDQYLRHRYPQRHRLKNRLRYLLTKTVNFDLWEDAERGWICGRSAWRGRSPVPLDPEVVSHLGKPDRPPQYALGQLFDFTGGPVEFDAITAIFAIFWGVRDSVSSLDAVEKVASSTDPAVDDVLSQKQDFAKLWAEIEDLPGPQRSALLLNLRDAAGGRDRECTANRGTCGDRRGRVRRVVGQAAVERSRYRRAAGSAAAAGDQSATGGAAAPGPPPPYCWYSGCQQKTGGNLTSVCQYRNLFVIIIYVSGKQ
jgi:DNA-directed RNA polymerase specialized sigma24 family protein